MSENKLYGKKISFNGDSICEGVGFPGGYGKIIAERNNMTYQNLGVGGGTIAVDVYTKSGELRYSICGSIDKMDSDADYAIVEGGVNDGSNNLVVGTPVFGEITNGYEGPFDDKTFCGAFESMLKQLTVKFAGKKIGYIAVHQCVHKFRPQYEKDDNFYRAALRICEKWGVPYLDLTSSTPPMSFFRAKYEGAPELERVSEGFTKDNDGTHPNEAGYLAFYCDKIEEWLKTL